MKFVILNERGIFDVSFLFATFASHAYRHSFVNLKVSAEAHSSGEINLPV